MAERQDRRPRADRGNDIRDLDGLHIGQWGRMKWILKSDILRSKKKEKKDILLPTYVDTLLARIARTIAILRGRQSSSFKIYISIKRNTEKNKNQPKKKTYKKIRSLEPPFQHSPFRKLQSDPLLDIPQVPTERRGRKIVSISWCGQARRP